MKRMMTSKMTIIHYNDFDSLKWARDDEKCLLQLMKILQHLIANYKIEIGMIKFKFNVL